MCEMVRLLNGLYMETVVNDVSYKNYITKDIKYAKQKISPACGGADFS